MEKPSAGKKKSKRKNTPVKIEESRLKPLFDKPKKAEPAEGHEFWKSQPVPKYAEVGKEKAHIGVMENNVANADTIVVTPNHGYLTETLEGVRKENIDLPEGLEWCEFDIQKDVTPVYEFLRDHYTNGNAKFQFHYSPQFLQWAMCPPGYSPSLHIGIRVKGGSNSGNETTPRTVHASELVGFVSGAPCTVRVYGVAKRMVEINFLCIRAGERNIKLAPLLIEEVARRVRWIGVWQAIYTSIRQLPHSLATVQYYHRPLNVRKLIDVEFTTLREGLSIASHEKLYVVPGHSLHIRKLSKRDISGACRLVNTFLQQYHIAQEFTKEEFTHTFLHTSMQEPKSDESASTDSLKDSISTGSAHQPNKFVYSYVVMNDGAITGFISFYEIRHRVNVICKHTELRAGYSFYNVAGPNKWTDITAAALDLAQKEGIDVFNCLDVMENSQFFAPLKFTSGSGVMRYHLYNWNCPPTIAEGIGVVLK